jgi:hypothetical protein
VPTDILLVVATDGEAAIAVGWSGQVRDLRLDQRPGWPFVNELLVLHVVAHWL